RRPAGRGVERSQGACYPAATPAPRRRPPVRRRTAGTALSVLLLATAAPAADSRGCLAPETWGRLTGTTGVLPPGGDDCSTSSTTPRPQYLPSKLWHLP